MGEVFEAVLELLWEFIIAGLEGSNGLGIEEDTSKKPFFRILEKVLLYVLYILTLGILGVVFICVMVVAFELGKYVIDFAVSTWNYLVLLWHRTISFFT